MELDLHRVLKLAMEEVPNKFPQSELAKYLANVAKLRGSHKDFKVSVEQLMIDPRSTSQLFDKHKPSPQYQELFDDLRDNEGFCTKRECFKNATMATLLFDKQGVQYCEGYATPHFAPIPIHHAWNLLPDGTVVDCTWCGHGDEASPPGSEYIGVAVPIAEVRSWVGAKRSVGIFHYPEVVKLLKNPPSWLWRG